MPLSPATQAPLHPKHWPTWFVILLAAALARLPWPMQRGLGRALGALLHRTMRRRRRVAARNLELCLPELDAAARSRLLRAHFAALGISMFELARAWWGSVAPLRKGLVVEGSEHLDAARACGKGVLLVSGHFTTLEISARLACDLAPLAGMHRPYSQPALAWAVSRGRARYSTQMFSKHNARGAIRHLRQGGLLWYAPDQDPSRSDSVFVPFFGQPANTLSSSHQLARLSGASVLMFQHWRRDDGGYTLRLWPVLADFPSASAQADTARIMSAIETMARQAPEQYIWIHRRFKRRPDGVSAYR